jgi:hypothetical protein
MSKKDYYDILGVTKKSTPEEIREIKLLRENLKKHLRLIKFYLIQRKNLPTTNLDILHLKVELEELEVLILVVLNLVLSLTSLMIFLATSWAQVEAGGALKNQNLIAGPI